MSTNEILIISIVLGIISALPIIIMLIVDLDVFSSRSINEKLKYIFLNVIYFTIISIINSVYFYLLIIFFNWLLE